MTRQQDLDTVPLATWITLGMAGAVLAAAGWIYVTPPPGLHARGPSHSPSAAEAKPATGDPEPDAATPSPSEPAANALNIAPLMLDAESRSHLWSSDPVLATITTLIGPGGPIEPVEIQFGTPRAGRLPGSPLQAERLTVRYTNGRAEQKRETSRSATYSVSTPNCPLEVAVRKLPSTALVSNYRIAVLYFYSKKESRPLWVFTEASGALHRIDGDTCTVLVR